MNNSTISSPAARIEQSLIDRLRAFRGPYIGDGVHTGIHRDELLAALSQLSALRDQVAQLERELEISRGVGKNLFGGAQQLLDENLALKASQAAPLDVDRAMELADAYAAQYALANNLVAAREALRSHLTKGRA